jgi:hypothetical protein
MMRRERGPFLTAMALLLALLAFSNCTKVLQHLRDPAKLGIVVFGTRFESLAANLILGPLMGIVVVPMRTACGRSGDGSSRCRSCTRSTFP